MCLVSTIFCWLTRPEVLYNYGIYSWFCSFNLWLCSIPILSRLLWGNKRECYCAPSDQWRFHIDICCFLDFLIDQINQDCQLWYFPTTLSLTGNFKTRCCTLAEELESVADNRLLFKISDATDGKVDKAQTKAASPRRGF